MVVGLWFVLYFSITYTYLGEYSCWQEHPYLPLIPFPFVLEEVFVVGILRNGSGSKLTLLWSDPNCFSYAHQQVDALLTLHTVRRQEDGVEWMAGNHRLSSSNGTFKLKMLVEQLPGACFCDVDINPVPAMCHDVHFSFFFSLLFKLFFPLRTHTKIEKIALQTRITSSRKA